MFLKAGTVPLIMKWEDSLGRGSKTIAHFHDDSNPKVKSPCTARKRGDGHYRVLPGGKSASSLTACEQIALSFERLNALNTNEQPLPPVSYLENI